MNTTVPELYGELRPTAFAVAYRMLGSVSEAEDVVQEAFLRLHQTLQREEPIASPRAYVVTLVTRLAIDQLRSARVRREQYVGDWLPEPLVTDPSPAETAETADSLSLAFLVLLENLSPRQRAAFLLREVFQYSYAEVAEIVGTDVDGTRHLVARARQHMRQGRPRYYASRRQREELAERFFAAAGRGELSALEELLAQEVSLHGDGGGKVPALGRPVTGREQVAKVFSMGWSCWRAAVAGCTSPRSTANRGRWCWTHRTEWSRSWRWRWPTARSRRSTPSSIPTSCGTSRGLATIRLCWRRAASRAAGVDFPLARHESRPRQGAQLAETQLAAAE